jgi:hypothetical protein
MAGQDKFSASKFTLHPTGFLQKRERDIIDNEMKNDVRRKSWLNEARAQVIQLRQYQGEPYDLTQQNEWRLDSTSEQTREMEQCDAIRLEHLPIHTQKRKQHGTSTFLVASINLSITFRAKKLASENMATFAFRDANKALRNLQSGTAGKKALLKFQQSQGIIELAGELLQRTIELWPKSSKLQPMY